MIDALRARMRREPGAPPVAAPGHGQARNGTVERAGGGDEDVRLRSASRIRPWGPVWAGYAACAWALVFAAASFYWAAGGTAGIDTNAPAITTPVLARDPTWVAIMWGTGTLKVLGGLLALALVCPWGQLIPRRLLLVLAWGASALMGVYEGAASMVQHGLMVAGIIGIPAGLGRTSAWWHLVLWDPWWLAGGLLFGLAAWSYSRRTRGRPRRASSPARQATAPHE